MSQIILGGYPESAVKYKSVVSPAQRDSKEEMSAESIANVSG